MEMTLEITSYCEHYCEYCSTKATREGKALPYLEIENFIRHFFESEEKIVQRINISGGEPLSHPDFYKILKLCESYCKDVRVYTNALKHILFNSDVVKEIKVDANVCLVPGKKSYIPKKVNNIHLLKLVKQGKAAENNLPEVNMSLSGNNCKECLDGGHILLQADGKKVKSPCKKSY